MFQALTTQFQCGECLRTFKSSRALGTHKERSHKSDRKRSKNRSSVEQGNFLKCKECQKLFASKDHLEMHVEKQHGAERLQCAECNGKPVKNMAEHRRNVHRADSRAGCRNLSPSPCGRCGKMFSTAYAAKYHEQGCLAIPMHAHIVQGWTKEWSLGPAARGSKEAGFTQPWDHSFAQPCTYQQHCGSRLL